MKLLLTITAFCLASAAFSQNNKAPGTYQKKELEIPAGIVNAVVTSSCDCMNKLNLKTLTTSEEKKNAMNNCLRQGTKENEAKIILDKNAQIQKGYDAGKEYGVALGKKMRQLLNSNCPAFKALRE